MQGCNLPVHLAQLKKFENNKEKMLRHNQPAWQLGSTQMVDNKALKVAQLELEKSKQIPKMGADQPE